MRRKPSYRGSRRISHHSTHYHTRAGPHTDPSGHTGDSRPSGAGLSTPAPENYQTLCATYRRSTCGWQVAAPTQRPSPHDDGGTPFPSNTPQYPHRYRWSLPRPHRRLGFRSSWVSPRVCPLQWFSFLRVFNITDRLCAEAVYADASCCVNHGEKPSALKEKPGSDEQ